MKNILNRLSIYRHGQWGISQTPLSSKKLANSLAIRLQIFRGNLEDFSEISGYSGFYHG